MRIYKKKKIKQSFLNSLVDLALDKAEAVAKDAGHQIQSMPVGTISIALAQPNTIMLYFNEKNIVKDVCVGDPLEVKKDVL